ncbi:hypothetical protein JSE7799_00183 [Jannaschia seosinensis]|uniref:Uncharacterized protein n=1 Tax=Jannaschia seosinensis TaxID=313367 RepID=A0A0M7B4C8_9RHOB|nr:hypothetical protein [Jannaschia seosinensis]CUH11497.1 hypothetical protein JSE7799_00183 [Jannaschia seosinensis]
MKKHARRERQVRHEFGVITVVQEGRFRLSSDDGRSLLFALDRHAALEPQDLPALLTRRVAVACTDTPGRRALTARDIRPVGAR